MKLQIDLPDELATRLQSRAEEAGVSVDVLVRDGVQRVLDDEYREKTEEEILASIRRGILDAKAGRTRPIAELWAELDEIDRQWEAGEL